MKGLKRNTQIGVQTKYEEWIKKQETKQSKEEENVQLKYTDMTPTAQLEIEELGTFAELLERDTVERKEKSKNKYPKKSD